MDDMAVRRNRVVRRLVAIPLLAASVVLIGCGPELGPVSKLARIASPVLPETSDPSVVRVNSTYYIYGSNNDRRAPVTRTTNIDRSYTLAQKNAITSEAMPTKPPWTARSEQLWAPTVGKFGARWIMYFSADRPEPPATEQPPVHR